MSHFNADSQHPPWSPEWLAEGTQMLRANHRYKTYDAFKIALSKATTKPELLDILKEVNWNRVGGDRSTGWLRSDVVFRAQQLGINLRGQGKTNLIWNDDTKN